MQKEEHTLNIPSLVSTTRKRLGLSQDDFGRILGSSRFAVGSWEKGNIRPSRYTLEILLVISKIADPPEKKRIKDALILGGAALALYILLESAFRKDGAGAR